MSVQSISLTESKLITHKEASSALEIIWQWFYRRTYQHYIVLESAQPILSKLNFFVSWTYTFVTWCVESEFQKIKIKIFILNQIGMFYMSFDSSNQDKSNSTIFFMIRALNIILSVKIFSIFGKY
jgi:hypothetical protein